MQRILVVDDEPNILHVITQRLLRDGFETATARDGETALRMLDDGEFAAAILDIGLPGMDGFAVLRELRASKTPLPVIILTARDGVSDTVAGRDSGADD